MKHLHYLILFLFLTSCVGEDIVEVAGTTQIESGGATLMTDSSYQLKAVYIEGGNVVEDITFDFESSSPEVASISSTGLVTALSPGNTEISASAFGNKSNFIIVNVIPKDSSSKLKEIFIEGPKVVNFGETESYTAFAVSTEGDTSEITTGLWASKDESIATIDANGTLTTQGSGQVAITVDYEGLMAALFVSVVQSTKRNGTFKKEHYATDGDVSVELTGPNEITITLAENFSSPDAGVVPGAYLYLSPSTSAADAKSKGVEIAKSPSGGSHTYTLMVNNAAQVIADNDYVLVICSPYTITMGSAKLSE